MKQIVVNLKRFDIPKAFGGLSNVQPSEYIDSMLVPLIEPLQQMEDLQFTFYIQEAYLLRACELARNSSNIRIGCQSNYYEDVSIHGNFGAFTSFRTASAMKAMGVSSSLIGHFEERKHLNMLYQRVGIDNQQVINQILNQEIKMAQQQNMEVCYCIGESADQHDEWESVLLDQLSIGLEGVDVNHVMIGYEPLWSIGPGKQPADRDTIEKVIRLIKNWHPDLKVIYGGGVKQENASMLASIKWLDGGLIGLTNFKENLGFHPNEFLEIVELYRK